MHLFVIDDDVGQGLVLWAPRGATVRGELEGFIKAELKMGGYDMVYTPHIGKLKLFKTSGHFPYYKDAQFPAILDREQVDKVVDAGLSFAETTRRMEGVSQSFANTLNERTGMEMITPDRVIPDSELLDGFLLKPMNCPFHIKITIRGRAATATCRCVWRVRFGLPLEQSGALNGLTACAIHPGRRAHLLHRKPALRRNSGLPGARKIVLGTLGMTHYRVRLGLATLIATNTRQIRRLGQSRGACRDAVKTLGGAIHRGSWRGRVLRAQNRLCGQGCDWPRVAARDDSD
jgi:threonyl-tRNA synthetase